MTKARPGDGFRAAPEGGHPGIDDGDTRPSKSLPFRIASTVIVEDPPIVGITAGSYLQGSHAIDC